MADFTFRRARRDDFELLASWLSEPHVNRWWHHEFTPEAVERDFGPSVDGTEPSHDELLLLDGRPIGLIQHYWLPTTRRTSTNSPNTHP